MVTLQDCKQAGLLSHRAKSSLEQSCQDSVT